MTQHKSTSMKIKITGERKLNEKVATFLGAEIYTTLSFDSCYFDYSYK